MKKLLNIIVLAAMVAGAYPVTPDMPCNDGSVEISGAQLHGGQCVVVVGAHLLKESQKVRLMDTRQ